MDLYYIDYISVTNRSFLHRTPVGVKMAALALIIAVLMISKSPTLNGAVAGCAILLALACRIPLTILVPLMLYPTVFLAILFLSAKGLTFAAALMLARVCPQAQIPQIRLVKCWASQIDLPTNIDSKKRGDSIT